VDRHLFLFLGLCIILGMSLSMKARAGIVLGPVNLVVLAMIVPVVLGIYA